MSPPHGCTLDRRGGIQAHTCARRFDPRLLSDAGQIRQILSQSWKIRPRDHTAGMPARHGLHVRADGSSIRVACRSALQPLNRVAHPGKAETTAVAANVPPQSTKMHPDRSDRLTMQAKRSCYPARDRPAKPPPNDRTTLNAQRPACRHLHSCNLVIAGQRARSVLGAPAMPAAATPRRPRSSPRQSARSRRSFPAAWSAGARCRVNRHWAGGLRRHRAGE